MQGFLPLVQVLGEAQVRFLLIGVGGANYWAHEGGVHFSTKDRDLFVPRDPANLLTAWQVCERAGLQLWSGQEPLDQPRDAWLAERVVSNKALTRVLDEQQLRVDLTLTMAGYEFESVWPARRVFVADGVEVPVAHIRHIVESKNQAGRPKDHLFLATHEENLREIMGPSPIPKRPPTD